MAVYTNTLNAEDTSYFNRSKKRVNDTYLLGLAQNRYQQDVTQAQQRRSTADLTRQFSQMREKMPYGWGKRGMLNSGAWQRAQTDFVGDKARGLADNAANYAEQMKGLTLAQSQLGDVKLQSLTDLEEQETARRAAIAAGLLAATGRGY